MTLKIRGGKKSSEERLAALRIRVQTAFLVGGCQREDIKQQLTELRRLESILQRVPEGSLHVKPAAA